MKAEVTGSEMLREMTLTVKIGGVTAMRLRLWLGLLVIRAGARIIGCGIEVIK